MVQSFFIVSEMSNNVRWKGIEWEKCQIAMEISSIICNIEKSLVEFFHCVMKFYARNLQKPLLDIPRVLILHTDRV